MSNDGWTLPTKKFKQSIFRPVKTKDIKASQGKHVYEKGLIKSKEALPKQIQPDLEDVDWEEVNRLLSYEIYWPKNKE